MKGASPFQPVLLASRSPAQAIHMIQQPSPDAVGVKKNQVKEEERKGTELCMEKKKNGIKVKKTDLCMEKPPRPRLPLPISPTLVHVRPILK